MAVGMLMMGELSGPEEQTEQQGDQVVPAESTSKHPVAKPLVINRHSQLWYCDGATPFQYDTQTTLSAGYASGGTFRWDVTKGSDKVALENGQSGKTKINSHKIGIKSTDASAAKNDIEVRCYWSHNNQTSTLFHKMTVLAPSNALVSSGPDDSPVTMTTACSGKSWCDDSGSCTAQGYLTEYQLKVQDQFATDIPRDIEINETFDTFVSDFQGNDWPTPNIPPTLTTGAKFGDTYGVLACPGRFWPNPVHPGDNLAHNKVKHATQYYRVGSLTPGHGRIVKIHKAQYYLGYGRQE
ncbi:hypothetical protein P2G88_10265 [Aliiglaciecola sp. CAU 1673]|uniref:hypothetical protein n=1 Tax=Aliiglaciecola sp. CAU 1673 TaxID=3032595 RepID=UPI0023DB27CB|nr:hypothetical protein [Aliiglaciecola sp. CAU 1673]MDF2178632.1 hypothetical protein [Aliiglaciecola sp. CAU 1673]